MHTQSGTARLSPRGYVYKAAKASVRYSPGLHPGVQKNGLTVSPVNIVIRNGRVRAGYRCGEYLFGEGATDNKARGIVHIIGERPGSGHHNFSAYLSAPTTGIWRDKGKLDHNYSRVVSGISDTALLPELAAKETVKILLDLMKDSITA